MNGKIKNKILLVLLVVLMLIATPATAMIQGEKCLVPMLQVSAYLSKDDPNLTTEKVYSEMNERYRLIFDWLYVNSWGKIHKMNFSSKQLSLSSCLFLI